MDEGVAFAREHNYPLVIRPACTLVGTGGVIVREETEMRKILETGLTASPIHQALTKTSLLGWKDLEYEVPRDGGDDCTIACNMG